MDVPYNSDLLDELPYTVEGQAYLLYLLCGEPEDTPEDFYANLPVDEEQWLGELVQEAISTPPRHNTTADTSPTEYTPWYLGTIYESAWGVGITPEQVDAIEVSQWSEMNDVAPLESTPYHQEEHSSGNLLKMGSVAALKAQLISCGFAKEKGT